MFPLMNRLTLSLGGLLPALLCGLLASCRTKPPVVRHFLRMPADCAGGLSSIERAKWLKEARSRLPSRRELASTGHLALPAFSSELGTRLSGLEMLIAPGQVSGEEGLAVVAGAGQGATTMGARLLRCTNGHYHDVTFPVTTLSEKTWRFDPSRHAVVGITATGRPAVEFQWTGSTWQTHSLR
jgi:hypothetical protein